MEATATDTPAEVLTCAECETENRPGSSFCKACGGAIAPPAKCPKCEADVPEDSKFCSECGAKLVGPRPAAPVEASKPKVAPKKSAASKTLEREAKNLPPVRPKSSSIGTNLLFFVAIIMGIVVVIYVMNRDAPKSVSPFAGGPAPGSAPPPSAPPSAPPSGAAASKGSVSGTIRLSEALKEEGNGTIFLIVRNKGMPNRGPPIAARKIDAGSMPVSFAVSASDVMMPGMPFDGPFDIYARLDRDGNAMTKQPGDIVNEKPFSGAKPGDDGVEIVLDKRL